MSASLIRGKHIICRVLDRHSVEIHDDAAIYQDNGLIQTIGPFAELSQRYPHVPVLGSPDHVILPGFVNSHHHVGLTPLQLGSPDYALELWFASRMGARRVDLYLDTLYSAFEMIESGITTVQHLHGWMRGGPPAVHEAAGKILQAYDDIGMRASYSHALRDQNRLVYEADADFVKRLPAELQPAMEEWFQGVSLTLEDQMTLFDEMMDRFQGNSRQRIQLAPANLHWCSDKALEALRDAAETHNVPLHMHLLETAYQKEYARRRTGTTAVSHLQDIGLLGPKLTLGHGVWINQADIEQVAATGTHICHNCSSNLRLRSGVAALNEWEAHGIKAGIGLDEAGINDDRDMLQEMRMVLRLHREPGMDDRVPTCPQVLRMATEHGAHTTPFGDSIGTLAPGKAADMVLIPWSKLAYPFLDPSVAVVDALVQRAKRVDTVFVEGEPIFHEGRFTRVDKDAVLAELAESLSGPRNDEELARERLGAAVFPHVKQFYEGYLEGQVREPFYGVSSRR